MQIPLQIRFHNCDRSEAVEEIIRKKLDKLDRFFNRVTAFRVTVEVPHRNHQKGNVYHVRIEVTVPGGELVVSNHAGGNIESHQDIHVAITHAFDAIAKQLHSHMAQIRGFVKVHEERHTKGKVVRMAHADGYGFIETADMLEIYFHRNAVVDDKFDTLNEGDEVYYTLADGEGIKGPQASTVKLVA